MHFPAINPASTVLATGGNCPIERLKPYLDRYATERVFLAHDSDPAGNDQAQRLKDAGLDHVQLSFQDSTRELNDFLSHTKTFELKKKVAQTIKAHDWPMVMNCVLHRHNLPHVGQIIEMALDLGAEYLELANVQYYGWAWVNRDHLMPTRAQLQEAEAVVQGWRERIGKQCRLLFVVPDYFEERPKACMNGWGSVFLSIAPDGLAMPCHNARDLPGLQLPNVREQPIADIWQRSQAFNAYRGQDWMQEPCRSCDERYKDFGGCRCQAFMVTGDAAATDPLEAKARAANLNYVKLDGQVGIIGNGAGLVMSTLDVVAYAGENHGGVKPANFLDIGGGASAAVMAESLEIVLSDPQVESVFINVYGGITSCVEVANGILEAVAKLGGSKPIVVRFDGNAAAEGLHILASANNPNIHVSETMEGAAAKAAQLAGEATQSKEVR